MIKPHANTAAQTASTCVRSAQIRKDTFKPDRQQQVTATVGVNPSPPAQRSASVQFGTLAPYSAGSPISYSPYGLGYDGMH